MLDDFPDSVRSLGDPGVTGDVVANLVMKGRRAISTIKHCSGWNTAEYAILHDVYNESATNYSVVFSTKFREEAKGYGYTVRKTSDKLTLYCRRGKKSLRQVAQYPLSNDKHNMYIDLKIVLDMMNTLQASDVSRIQAYWPYGFDQLFSYYDSTGKKMQGADELLPEFIWDALCGRRHERTVQISSELSKELGHLHAVLGGDENMKERIKPNDALALLTSSRIQRLKYTDRGVRSKRFMSVTPWSATTFNKFYTDESYDVVIHPGSGPIDRLSSTAFLKSKRVFCIDPVFDEGFGRVDGIRSTWEDWVESEPDLSVFSGRVLICSDACAIIRTTKETRPSDRFTGLDEVGTNIIADRILTDSQRMFPNADIILKVALQDPKDLPDDLRAARVHLHSKVRLHNAEIIVRVAKDGGGITMDALMHRIAYIVYRANLARERMDTHNVFPGGDLSSVLDVYRPKVRQMCGFIHSTTQPPRGGVRHVGVTKGVSIEIDVEGSKLCKYGGHDDVVTCISMNEVEDLTFAQAARLMIRRKPWVGKYVILRELAGMALSLGYEPDTDVGTIMF